MCAGAVERGVLLRPLGDVIVLVPPLTVTAGEIDRIVSVLVESISEVCNADGVALDDAMSGAGRPATEAAP